MKSEGDEENDLVQLGGEERIECGGAGVGAEVGRASPWRYLTLSPGGRVKEQT